MSAILAINRAGPLTTVQDDGRFGMLSHGVSASGPMDLAAFAWAGAAAGGGRGGIEITMAGVELTLTSGDCHIGWAGGDFAIAINGKRKDWPGSARLKAGYSLAITPGRWGNYGYLRFDRDIAVPEVMGSIATSTRARLGGLSGRALQVGDLIELTGGAGSPQLAPPPPEPATGPIRIIWGLHADLFAPAQRQHFLDAAFVVSRQLDRMGARLDDKAGVFADTTILSLASDAIVPGDIQILGDGTPIVLLRDHQPTGGYPRIGTIITADLDRFAQLRPGTAVAFEPVTVEHAHQLLRSRRT
ncbi:biotin-dependent carboxyltransferase family protein [Devosia sp. SL43]|uniref:5-oxoprolinase subunit C family protein n=1 Tax=Devosia sp. SL43 TaxID=2806348 RepID=UPI001F1E9086|nr:biotin-dependent carboxyltransferase family protein [Devosia sp. SL43]UJW86018.1 biotin-dependent carboxyltransferase family protein [Devosia sp. SL43]